jgi:hypothetical protein
LVLLILRSTLMTGIHEGHEVHDGLFQKGFFVSFVPFVMKVRIGVKVPGQYE